MNDRRRVRRLAPLGLLAPLLTSAALAKPLTIPAPASSRFALENGLRVIVVEDHRLPVVALALRFGAGALREPAGKAGLSNLTAELLASGAAVRSRAQIEEALEAIGGSYSARAWWDATDLLLQVHSRDRGAAIELLADLALRPVFAPAEVESVRERTLQIIALQATSADRVAADALAHLLYGDGRLGRPRIGTASSVRALTRDDVVRFHRGLYVGHNAVLVVVGAVRAEEMRSEIARAFGALPAGAAPPAIVPPRPAGYDTRMLVIDWPGAERAAISCGHLGIDRRHADYEALRLDNEVLGGLAGNSRLALQLSTRRELVDDVYAHLLALSVPGPFVMRTTASHDDVPPVIAAALAEIERLRLSGPSAKELRDAKTYLIGGLPFALESAGGSALALLKIETYGLGDNYLTGYGERIENISQREAAQAARTFYVSSAVRCAVVGDAAQLVEQLAPLGRVTRLDAAGWDQQAVP
ncbi:MAG: insulinase family protein [Deltaproteobacteria bacterium]|nr:insulinase family protein [Deltaproteobacteria bacterium]